MNQPDGFSKNKCHLDGFEGEKTHLDGFFLNATWTAFKKKKNQLPVVYVLKENPI